MSERKAPRRCECPCNEPLPPGVHARRRYINERHKDRAYRKRLNEAAEAAGVPARLSLEKLQASNPTSDRRADAKNGGETRRRRSAPRRLPGVPGYWHTVPLAEDQLAQLERVAELLPGIDLSPTREVLARGLERRRKRAA